jgi:DNA (cytosine-5)-methyltransferase 1
MNDALRGKKMTFLDLFAGVGGFRRGMELAGHKCIGFCEWDKFARMSYISMHCITEDQRKYLATLDMKNRQKEILKDEYLNGEWCSTDIRSVNARNIPKADCWCFGAPCQDFSVAGKRAGLEGDRSSLIREVFRVLWEIKEENRPEWLIYENVKGMLSSNRGGDYLAILMEMDELGYDIEWQNFNSKYYVPQNRERIYTIGHLRIKGAAKILPIMPTDRENCVCGINQIGRQPSANRDNPNAGRVYAARGISPALNTMEGGGREPHVAIPVSVSKKAEVCVPVLTPDRTEKRQNGRRFKENGDEAFTLTAQDRHGVAVGVEVEGSEDHPGMYVELPDGCIVYAVWYEKYECYIAIRKLTPRETWRLQGWDDDYFDKAEFVNSDSQLYKQAGNGVTVNVVQAIAERL